MSKMHRKKQHVGLACGEFGECSQAERLGKYPFVNISFDKINAQLFRFCICKYQIILLAQSICASWLSPTFARLQQCRISKYNPPDRQTHGKIENPNMFEMW